MPELHDEMNVIDDQAYKGMIKKLSDGVGVKGAVTSIKHYKPDQNGDFERGGIKYKLFEERSVENTLCDLGNALAAKIFADNTGTRPSHMSVGETSGGKTSASTVLEAPVAPRVALDSTTCPASGNPGDNIIVYVCTFVAGVGSGALKEAGLFNHLTAGTMICYAEYGIITKEAADIVNFTWTITFGSS